MNPRVYKTNLPPKIVLKVFTLPIRANRPSVYLRRYSFPIKTLKFSKKSLLPLYVAHNMAVHDVLLISK